MLDRLIFQDLRENGFDEQGNIAGCWERDFELVELVLSMSKAVSEACS